MSPNPKLIKAILTNNTLNEEEKSKIIAEFIENIQKEYPELKYHATKSDVKEVELKLTKEIEKVRKEIKEVELKLTQEIEEVRKEIKEVELKLTQEIEEVRKEVKEIELKLTQEIEEIKKEIEKVRKETKEIELKLIKEIENSKISMIKWSFIFWVSQFSAILFLIYKILKG